jgi:hypothetical protein
MQGVNQEVRRRRELIKRVDDAGGLIKRLDDAGSYSCVFGTAIQPFY